MWLTISQINLNFFKVGDLKYFVTVMENGTFVFKNVYFKFWLVFQLLSKKDITLNISISSYSVFIHTPENSELEFFLILLV